MKDGADGSASLGHGSAWGLSSDASLGEDDPLGVDERARYVSSGLIGQGGMGVVEAVRDRRLDREVARKRASPELPAPIARALLAHEARALGRLDHPNIVTVHDAGRGADGEAFLTMRLVRGRTLADALTAPRSAADRPRLIRHLLEAARGLAHAHARGVVHADLKPSNLLIGPYGETQVADWGLARIRDPDAPTSPLGGGAGTPPWRAPEVEADGVAEPASDVYALGVVLREILSGDARRTTDDAPVDLLAVLRRATATDPAARYPDGATFAADLERWLDGRPVLAHAYSPRELFARLVWAWRVPLAVAAVAGAVLSVTLAQGALRLAHERDRAVDAERRATETAARLWTDRAVDALRRDDRPAA